MVAIMVSGEGKKNSGSEAPQDYQQKDLDCVNHEFEDGRFTINFKIGSEDTPLK